MPPASPQPRRFLPASFRVSGLVKAWEAVTRAAGGSTFAPVPAIALPDRRVSITLRKKLEKRKLPDTLTKLTEEDRVHTPPAMEFSTRQTVGATTPPIPGNYPKSPEISSVSGQQPILTTVNCASASNQLGSASPPQHCVTPTSVASRPPAPPRNDLPILQTPESPSPRRDVFNGPPPMFTLTTGQVSGDGPCDKLVPAVPAPQSCGVALPTADSHLPSPPPSPEADHSGKLSIVAGGPLASTAKDCINTPDKIFRDIAIQTDPILSVAAALKRRSMSAAAGTEPMLTQSMDQLQPPAPTSVLIPKANLQEIRSLLADIENMECLKNLTSNLCIAKTLLAEIKSLASPPASEAGISGPGTPKATVANPDEEATSKAPSPRAPGHGLEPMGSESEKPADVCSDSPLPLAPPNSLADGVCKAADAPTLAAETNPTSIIPRKRKPSMQFIETRARVCLGLAISELKSFHATGKKLHSPVARRKKAGARIRI